MTAGAFHPHHTQRMLITDCVPDLTCVITMDTHAGTMKTAKTNQVDLLERRDQPVIKRLKLLDHDCRAPAAVPIYLRWESRSAAQALHGPDKATRNARQGISRL